jgi:ATP-dependent helicase HrpB
MLGGRGVLLDEKSSVKKSDFFLALRLADGLLDSETKVSLSSGLLLQQIEQLWPHHLQAKTWVEFDADSQKVVQKKCRALTTPWGDSLELESPRVSPATTEEAQKFLPEIAQKALPLILEKNEPLGKWFQRFQFFCKHQPQVQPLTEQDWKLVFESACYGENQLSSLFSKDLLFFVEQQIPAAVVTQFHQQCPSAIQVPSGSQIRIQYSEEIPVLEVRLQEIFGMLEPPKILNGLVPLKMVLLAPNYRPVQVTQDLASFWKNGYFEVKKELKTRYPKHSWPEDPLTAVPQAKGRPRQS